VTSLLQFLTEGFLELSTDLQKPLLAVKKSHLELFGPTFEAAINAQLQKVSCRDI
jgi:hypothetical protein